MSHEKGRPSDDIDSQLSDQLFARFADLLYRKAGILLKEYKKYLVVNRLSRLVGPDQAYPSFNALYNALRGDSDGNLMAEFVNALTTNYSYFFRDPVHFQSLEQYVRDKAGTQEYLHFWSAASSTGEEAFSIAITLLKHRELLPADTKILATDISTRVLRHAERGLFPAASIDARVEPGLLKRYFIRLSDPPAYQVRPEVREMVRFRYLNLLSEYPFKKQMDIIFLRNVLIYFGMEEKREAVLRACDCLKPGGFLVIGLSESLVGVDTPLKTRGNSIYEKYA